MDKRHMRMFRTIRSIAHLRHSRSSGESDADGAAERTLAVIRAERFRSSVSARHEEEDVRVQVPASDPSRRAPPQLEPRPSS